MTISPILLQYLYKFWPFFKVVANSTCSDNYRRVSSQSCSGRGAVSTNSASLYRRPESAGNSHPALSIWSKVRITTEYQLISCPSWPLCIVLRPSFVCENWAVGKLFFLNYIIGPKWDDRQGLMCILRSDKRVRLERLMIQPDVRFCIELFISIVYDGFQKMN